MLILLNGLLVSLILISLVFYSFFTYTTRFVFLNEVVSLLLGSLVSSNVGNSILYFLFVTFFFVNLIGNIPLNIIPTMFYSATLTVSLIFWLPLVICVSFTQLNEFLAHILPYGCPVGLMLFLPLVEVFSQLIRPLTLMIRLSTNLSSGHIIIYMFSYFTLLSSFLSPFIYTVLFILFILELAISLLQAYIFVSLLSLYVSETV